MIWIFVNGGPSHVDTWDYKPALAKWHDKSMTEFDAEFKKGLRPEGRLFKETTAKQRPKKPKPKKLKPRRRK